MAPFLAMAKLKQAWLCSSGLTKTFYFIAHFLAMAKLKQAWFCSSGLTKMFLKESPICGLQWLLTKVVLFANIQTFQLAFSYGG
jgi:hypothetical protein